MRLSQDYGGCAAKRSQMCYAGTVLGVVVRPPSFVAIEAFMQVEASIPLSPCESRRSAVHHNLWKVGSSAVHRHRMPFLVDHTTVCLFCWKLRSFPPTVPNYRLSPARCFFVDCSTASAGSPRLGCAYFVGMQNHSSRTDVCNSTTKKNRQVNEGQRPGPQGQGS